MAKTVTVIGSYNVGLFLNGKILPKAGETIIADKFYESGGGKGSNQAVSASKMGAKTRFIGRVGSDNYGKDAFAMYDRLGICRDSIAVDNTIHTGISVILVDENGQNLISVVPGANYNLSKADIDAALESMRDSEIVGFQLENNPKIVAYGLEKVSALGIKTLLDPAPAAPLPEKLYQHIYCIKPNEHEAKVLTGIPVDGFDSACKAGEWFLNKGVKVAIITLGELGAVLVTKDGGKLFKAPRVTAIDTTGAGDCFSGALMAGLANGKTMEEAIVFANHAAALSVTKCGVIESIPSLDEVEAFMKEVCK